MIAVGLFHVNRVARIAAIYIGLCVFIPILWAIALWILSLTQIPLLQSVMEAWFDFLGSAILFIWEMMPQDLQVLAVFLMVVYIGQPILNLLAMIILFVFGGDFKSEPKKKSMATAYVLWFFLGGLSTRKFYLGKDRSAIVFFLTLHGFGIGWLIGLFTLWKQVDAANAESGFPRLPHKKSKLVAYLLWFFLGFWSAHKLYLENGKAAIVFFFTLQGLWVGWFIGLFTLGKQVDAYNAKLGLN